MIDNKSGLSSSPLFEYKVVGDGTRLTPMKSTSRMKSSHGEDEDQIVGDGAPDVPR